jgi:nucleoside-diphosphate-sugar epimerase
MLLVLGAGYIGAKVAELALARGEDVVLADNWDTTRREEVEDLGAEIRTLDVREEIELEAERVIYLAAQASRPRSWEDPAYTEQTNLVGARHVAQAVGDRIPVTFGSSLHVYGPDLSGEIGAEQPYGRQGDLAHLSKIYAEQCLLLYGVDVRILRLGIVYGPSPVEHEEKTVVDKFRELAARGESLPLDDGGRATLGVVHVADAARILLDAVEPVSNVAAETVTVGQIAALAQGRDPASVPAARWRFTSPFTYEHDLAGYLR